MLTIWKVRREGVFKQVILHMLWPTLLIFCDGGPGAKSYRRSLSIVYQNCSRGRCYVKLYLKSPQLVFQFG